MAKNSFDLKPLFRAGLMQALGMAISTEQESNVMKQYRILVVDGSGRTASRRR